MANFLGIDLGTSATKVGVFNEKGERVALASAPCAVSRPNPGWFEQRPDDWWGSVISCLKQIWSAGVAPSEIESIGLSGHFTTVFLTESGQPARPAITWQDARAADEAAELARTVGPDDAQKLLGIDLPFSPSMPPARVAWVTKNDSNCAGDIRWIAQTKDYIASRLTGEVTSDRHSMLGLVHTVTGQTDEEYLNRLGITSQMIPRLAEPDEVVGCVSKVASRETGLPVGVPVAAGWIDAYCSMVGTGMNLPQCAFDYAGTSEIVGLLSSEMPSEPCGLLAIPLKPGKVAMYGLTNCGSGSLAWAVEAIGGGEPIEKLLAEAETAPPGCDGLLFLPYLDGERSPIWDAAARATFLGIDSQHKRPHFLRAVLEGVAFSVSQIIGIARTQTGIEPIAFMVSGGGAKSALWSQIRADVSQLAVNVCKETETGALGAAILAAVAGGFYGDMSEAAANMVSVERTVEPNAGHRTLYAESQARYEAAYPAIRDVSRRSGP